MEKEALEKKREIIKDLRERGISAKMDKDVQKAEEEENMKRILNDIMKKHTEKKRMQKIEEEKRDFISKEDKNEKSQRSKATIKHEDIRKIYGKRYIINELKSIYGL